MRTTIPLLLLILVLLAAPTMAAPASVTKPYAPTDQWAPAYAAGSAGVPHLVGGVHFAATGVVPVRVEVQDDAAMWPTFAVCQDSDGVPGCTPAHGDAWEMTCAPFLDLSGWRADADLYVFIDSPRAYVSIIPECHHPATSGTVTVTYGS